ncbi:MAG: Eco57I restriction-modification methylase domain-containing protein [Gemmatimonadaceae bacterium]
MRSAAAALAAPPGIDALAAIAALAGFGGVPAALASGAREALGLPPSLLDVRVQPGPGALRALLLRCNGTESTRDTVQLIAARLASRTPQLRWLAIAEDEQANDRIIATWSPEKVPPRVAALHAQRNRLVDSDAETVCAIAAAAGPDDVLTHARWLEVLGRDALRRRFYRELESGVDGAASSLPAVIPSEDRRSLALFVVSRLLFLAFLEAKGWLDDDRAFLARVHAATIMNGGGVHRRLLEPLFFGTLNTRVAARAPAARAFGRIPYLNGGLFTRTALEKQWRHAGCSDDALATLFDGIFARYRLTAREDRATWSDAAIDPEMLGRAFESLMASDVRRSSGAFFTPHALVGDVTSEALARHLGATLGGDDAWRLVRGERPTPRIAALAAARLESLRVLDPACGSGAFLVHALERIADLRLLCGDERDAGTIRRETLSRSIFGVDANPAAVWLCELRLWLSTVIETDVTSGQRVPTLPNLDHNIRVGDSLAGAGFGAASFAEGGSGRAVAALRIRYARATGVRKRSLGHELDRAERGAALRSLDRQLTRLTAARRELLTLRRQRDLFGRRNGTQRPDGSDPERERLRTAIRGARAERRALVGGGSLPFSFRACFPDVAAAGGFDLVIANPPWVRLHNIPARSRERLRETFAVFRFASWEPGALGAGAGRGFAAQVDLSALFVERSVDLLVSGGTLAILLPSKLWRSLAGGGVRRWLIAHAPPVLIEELAESAAAFDAAVYPSLLVAVKDGCPTPVMCTHRRRDTVLRWNVDRAGLAFDDSPGSPWILAPPEAHAGFDRLRRDADTLATSVVGRPLLGVKCGLNEAFVIGADNDIAAASWLRPLVRGETLSPWRVSATERIIWTHGADGVPLRTLPAGALAHLAAHRRGLTARSDLRGSLPWWSLFRTESARVEQARVVWADVGRSVRAAFVAPGDPLVALNSCYIVRCPSVDDALAMLALLNSPLASAWLSLVAEPARGGYHRYLGWTMAMLPVPRDWARARDILAPLGREGVAGSPPSPHELLDRAIAAWRVRRCDVAPLVEWAS